MSDTQCDDTYIQVITHADIQLSLTIIPCAIDGEPCLLHGDARTLGDVCKPRLTVIEWRHQNEVLHYDVLIQDLQVRPNPLDSINVPPCKGGKKRPSKGTSSQPNKWRRMYRLVDGKVTRIVDSET